MKFNKIRNKIEPLLLKIICQLTSNNETTTSSTKLHRTKILSGPLQGRYFSMPQLERLSFALGTYEPHVLQCMKQFIKPGAITYDIGANAGYFTLVMSVLVQHNGGVFAFEPDSKNFSALGKNLKDNDVENVKIFQRAVSDNTGELIFASFECSLVGHIATPNTPDDAILRQVKSTKLDDFVYEEGFPKPTFIKIDVEGAEEQVIVGADRLIREAKPVILAEVREGEIYRNIVDFLIDRDYHVEYLEGGWQLEQHHLGDLLFVPNSYRPNSV